MTIYIITCHRAYNYGAVLQAYALQTYLSSKGFETKIINYLPPYLRKISKKYQRNIIAKIIRKIVYYPDYKKSAKVFNKFLNEQLVLTSKEFRSFEELETYFNMTKSSLFIAGSDQIWNCNLENGKDESYFLSFVNKESHRISYAASIGLYSIPADNLERYKSLLSCFDGISVREQSAVELLKEIGIASTNVLDPVFLLEREKWNHLLKSDTLKIKNEKYVLVYALHHCDFIYKYADRMAKKINCKLYVINVEIKEKRRKHDLFFWNPDVVSFLNLIKNSFHFVTNSFHGVCFGTIFEKQVHIFDTENNDPRINDFVIAMGLENRVLKNKINNNILHNDMNYADFYIKKNKSLKYSEDFLEHFLNR